ncbi:MAG TPA: 5'-methylthioadenosine/S-adenosylhomocysteine nucleosidase [Vicinamibacterales bacterium]|nr:5'-methylthioadenosine/S-adenosylhomocysteine nucleosidase [Vicinamibacterales bacterium]
MKPLPGLMGLKQSVGRGVAAALVSCLAIVCAAGCTAAARTPIAAPARAAQPYPAADIVVQGAVDTELQPLLEALEGSERIQIAAWTFWRGRIAGKNVVVSRTEVGPVNASTATTLAIVNFRPRLIINQGTAGAAISDLELFDIVVGEASVDYGAFRSTPAGPGAGVDLSRWTPMPHRLRLDGVDRIAFDRFPGDQAAVAAALAVANPRGRVVKGVIGTAFEFNREVDRLVWMNRTYGVVSEDMESAYAAGTAAGFRTPFVAVRIISDSEFHGTEFQPVAGEYCAAFVLELVRALGTR